MYGKKLGLHPCFQQAMSHGMDGCAMHGHHFPTIFGRVFVPTHMKVSPCVTLLTASLVLII